MEKEHRILHVAVGVPSGMNLWIGDMGIALAGMCSRFAQEPVFPGVRHKLSLIHVKGSILPKIRSDMIKMAIESGAEWLLMVDSDQTFPPDTLHRLIRHDKDVVAANVATKQLPSNWTARAKPRGNPSGEVVRTGWKSTGLQQVWRIGTGVILFRMNVLKRLGIGKLAIRFRPDIQDYQGEDWSLMEALEKEGIPVWIDHDLSKEVLHYGWYEFGINDAEGQSNWWRDEAVG